MYFVCLNTNAYVVFDSVIFNKFNPLFDFFPHSSIC